MVMLGVGGGIGGPDNDANPSSEENLEQSIKNAHKQLDELSNLLEKQRRELKRILHVGAYVAGAFVLGAVSYIPVIKASNDCFKSNINAIVQDIHARERLFYSVSKLADFNRNGVPDVDEWKNVFKLIGKDTSSWSYLTQEEINKQVGKLTVNDYIRAIKALNRKNK